MKIISNKDQGKRFSEISKYVEQQLIEWLKYSNIDCEHVKREFMQKEFQIESEIINQKLIITAKINNQLMLTPLIIEANNEESYLDAALLLLHLSSVINCEEAIKKTTEFIRKASQIGKI